MFLPDNLIDSCKIPVASHVPLDHQDLGIFTELKCFGDKVKHPVPFKRFLQTRSCFVAFALDQPVDLAHPMSPKYFLYLDGCSPSVG